MTRTFKKTATAIAILGLVGSAATAAADIPEEFTNLKVFPKDIGHRELVDSMREISLGLGVRCTHCHVERVPGDHDTIEWASDDLEAKRTAREMLQMVEKINADLLPEKDRRARLVRCITCHRGLTNPATLDQVLLKAAEKGGAAAVVDEYKRLREQYYGSGSYDFGPQTLTDVAVDFAQERKDAEGALQILKLNLSEYPDHTYSLLMSAQLHLAAGDKAAAKEYVAKALALEPDNQHAKRLLEQIEPPQ